MFFFCLQLQHPMTIHIYHPYRQPDGVNHCQAVNGHCSHLCLPAPQINAHSPKISCACPTGLKLMNDGLMCIEDGKFYKKKKISPITFRVENIISMCEINTFFFYNLLKSF